MASSAPPANLFVPMPIVPNYVPIPAPVPVPVPVPVGPSIIEQQPKPLKKYQAPNEDDGEKELAFMSLFNKLPLFEEDHSRDKTLSSVNEDKMIE